MLRPRPLTPLFPRSQASVRPGVAAPQEHAPASYFTTVPSHRPAIAVDATSARLLDGVDAGLRRRRGVVWVAASGRPGGRACSMAWRRRVQYLDVTACTHLTRSCPRRGKEEDRQGAFFYLSRGRATRRACSRTRRRDARAPVSSAPISPVSSVPSPQARAMIEYHKCRVSSFSNWASYCAEINQSRPRFTSYSHRARPRRRRSSSTRPRSPR